MVKITIPSGLAHEIQKMLIILFPSWGIYTSGSLIFSGYFEKMNLIFLFFAVLFNIFVMSRYFITKEYSLERGWFTRADGSVDGWLFFLFFITIIYTGLLDGEYSFYTKYVIDA